MCVCVTHLYSTCYSHNVLIVPCQTTGHMIQEIYKTTNILAMFVSVIWSGEKIVFECINCVLLIEEINAELIIQVNCMFMYMYCGTSVKGPSEKGTIFLQRTLSISPTVYKTASEMNKTLQSVPIHNCVH